MSKVDAAQIRLDLKNEMGLKASQVSVRTCRSTGSLDLRVKDPTADYAAIEAIALRQERIHRDGFGDILSWGNTFVSVSWSNEARAIRGGAHLAAVQAAIAELEAADSDSVLIPVEGAPGTLIGWAEQRRGMGFRLWHAGTAGMWVNTPECAAAMVADYQSGAVRLGR